MAAKPMRIARHVYLRTQQRRLRHVKGVLIRNLTLPFSSLDDPLHISVYFTVHPPHNPTRVLFRSDPVQDSYNPSWESIQLASPRLGHSATIPTFVLRVWVKCGREEEEGEEEGEYGVAFEKMVELFDLAYLGLMVNKDGSSYPPNSVVVGMYEGYYSHPEVGGVPCAPRIVHSLTDYLPPQSLLEVPKKEVVDSYFQRMLTSILDRQEVLNGARREANSERAKVERSLQLERMCFEKRSERERLATKLKLLRTQLQELEAPQMEESEQLERITKQVDETEKDLVGRQTELKQKWENLSTASGKFARRKDQMMQSRRNKHLRQRHMVYELANTFTIKEREETFTVCNVILPNADQLDQPSSVEQLGVALGYVAHLVYHLGKTLVIPLLYPIRPHGSKSVICDLISDETLIDNIKEFPLFARGSEKALFQYAVFLLNKDIAQVRQHCGYGTSKSMFKKTLPNLKFLLDRLTRDVRAMMQGDQSGFQTPFPSDTTSMTASYVSVDAMSVASSTMGSPSYRNYPNMSPQGSVYPPSLTLTQQFIRHNGTNFSPPTASQQRSHTQPQQPARETNQERYREASPEGESVDKGGEEVGSDVERDDSETPLADETTEHTFTQSFGALNEASRRWSVEAQHPQLYFSTIHEDTPPSGDEDGGASDGRLSGSAEDSNTSGSPSLSTTPIVTDERELGSRGLAMNQPFSNQLNSAVDDDRHPSDSVMGLSSSATQVGSLEETLKSAMHVTQVLLGHTPPEHIQIEPAPMICSTNEAEIESTQALLNLTTASFMGGNQRVKESPELTADARETSPQGAKEELAQGPQRIPDSIELSLLSNRQSRGSNLATEDDHAFSNLPLTRPRAMAYTTYTMDGGYMKTGMATPHTVGSSSERKRHQESLYPSTVTHESRGGSAENEEDGQNLADFIDGPSELHNRWRGGLGKVRSRGAH